MGNCTARAPPSQKQPSLRGCICAVYERKECVCAIPTAVRLLQTVTPEPLSSLSLSVSGLHFPAPSVNTTHNSSHLAFILPPAWTLCKTRTVKPKTAAGGREAPGEEQMQEKAARAPERRGSHAANELLLDVGWSGAGGCDWTRRASVMGEEAPLDESRSDCCALPHLRWPLAV